MTDPEITPSKPGLRERVRAFRSPDADPGRPGGRSVEARLAALEEAVDENRRLNQRLADVIDVVTEVLVPAADRDDARLQKALKDLNQTLG